MSRHLEVRIDVGTDTSEDALQLTRTSIERSLRHLRRVVGAIDVAILVTGGPGRDDHGAPVAGGLVAVCSAGEMLDRRFLAAAVTALDAHGPRAVVHADRVLVASSTPELLRTPDSRRAPLKLEAFLDADPWPGARVTSAAVDAELGGLGGGLAGSVAAVAAGIPQLTVVTINVVPPGLAGERGSLPPEIDANHLATGLDRLQADFDRPAPEWEAKHPVTSGPIRIVRRGGRGLRRRARALTVRTNDLMARRGAVRRLRQMLPEFRDLPESVATTARGTLRFGQYAPTLVHAWQSLSRRADVLLVTADVSTRSSDQTALLYARALDGAGTAAGRVVIVTTGDPARTESGHIPPGVLHYPLPDSFRRLDDRLQGAFVVRLSQMVRARHVVIIDSGFQAAAGMLASADAPPRVWLHSTAADAAPLGALVGSEATLVTEGPRAARTLIDHLAADPERVRMHVPPPLPLIPDFDTVSQYTAAHDDVDFDEAHPFHVLWRTSDEDAPEREQQLEALLAAIDEARLPVRVHVHHEIGTRGPSDPPPRAAHARLEDDGSFTGGLLVVPSENYHALIVNATVADGRAMHMQAMLLGLPVLAAPTADVDLCEDRVTALLATSDRADALLDGIRSLSESRELRRAIIRGAYDRARSVIDTDPFGHAVVRDLALR